MGLYKRSKQLTLQHGLSVESTVKSGEMISSVGCTRKSLLPVFIQLSISQSY